jgi:hypothetical protein
LATITGIFPNPSTNEVNIQLEEAGQQKGILIYNANQEKVFESNTTEKEIVIETTSWPAGNYVVKITRGHRVSTQQLQIKH